MIQAISMLWCALENLTVFCHIIMRSFNWKLNRFNHKAPFRNILSELYKYLILPSLFQLLYNIKNFYLIIWQWIKYKHEINFSMNAKPVSIPSIYANCIFNQSGDPSNHRWEIKPFWRNKRGALRCYCMTCYCIPIIFASRALIRYMIDNRTSRLMIT